jgi:hypothetical protein
MYRSLLKLPGMDEYFAVNESRTIIAIIYVILKHLLFCIFCASFVYYYKKATEF